MESKSESKFSESKSEEKSSTPKEIVHITSIDINPNRCLITDPLTLAVDFTLDEAVNEGVWEIKVVLDFNFFFMNNNIFFLKFLVDSVSKRYIVILGAVELRNYRVGKNSFTFKTDKIDVSKIPPG